MPRLFVKDFTDTGWADPDRARDLARQYCERLEAGDILFFPACPFPFPEPNRQALLAHRQSGLKYHKNVSYQPLTGVVRGMSAAEGAEVEELRRILSEYSDAVVGFVDTFLAPYAGRYKLDFASYRPVEEEGRPMSLHKRNDLLHVDAFPNRPTAGGRILRVFTNLNPTKTRDWIVTDGFDRLAEQYAQQAGLPKYARQARSPVSRMLRRLAAAPFRAVGKLKGMPTAYDRFMQRFHNFLKENAAFQRDCPKEAIEFPPGSTWLVYTDYVPHAVLRGQFALEQTFIVHPEGLVKPELAPIRILERLGGTRLAA
ncbi:MAG: Kdo hydroxylase family protein [Zavarzinella sp.]|nr:Kdo hydroxylase family protein [Zavarzinella sp.]